MKKPEPIPMEVTVERKGETFRASYTVEKGIIAVFALDRIMSTHLGSLPPDIQARMMLREIIDTIKPSKP